MIVGLNNIFSVVIKMDFSENFNTLKNKMKKGNTFVHRNENTPLLPFVHRGDRVSIEKDGMYHVIGHLSRNLLGLKWDLDLSNEIITNLVDIPEFNDIEDNKVFEELLKEYLSKEDSHINITHPSMYRYIPPSYTLKTKYVDKTYGERKLALFFKDVFFKNPKKGIEFFNKADFNNDIFKFILSNYQLENAKNIEREYIPILNHIVDLFNKDFDFLLQYESFLMENLENFFAFYYFFYSTQLLLKLKKGFTFFKDEDTLEKVYYLLEGEHAHDLRISTHVGFNLINTAIYEALCRIYVIDHINILIGQHDFMLGDVLNYFKNDLNNSDREELYSNLYNWIEYYRDFLKLEKIDLHKHCSDENFIELINSYFDSMYKDDGVQDGIKTSRYPKNLFELGKAFKLIKFRGKYRYVLNMSNDMLLLLTALCVQKDTNIKVNDLFNKFEERGVFFDEESKIEITNFLDKRNLIDKKSDSEDAKYVKPIL